MDNIQLMEGNGHSELILGCHVKASLKWHVQVENLIKKLKRRLAALMTLNFVLPFKFRNTLALGIFNSVLSYCLPLFGGCDMTDIHKLQVIQNRAAQIVSGYPPRTHRKVIFTKLKWLTVNQMITFHTLLAVYKLKKFREPEYLASFFELENNRGHLKSHSQDFHWLKGVLFGEAHENGICCLLK